MRSIGQIDNLRHAEQFVAYLVTMGIPATADSVGEDRCEIWVHEEDQLEKAQSELANFLANPSDAKYNSVITQANRIRREQVDKRKRIEKKIVAGHERMAPRPRLTVLLIIICVVTSLLTNFGESRDNGIFKGFAFNAVPENEAAKIVESAKGNLDDLDLRLASVQRGEIWRLFTPIFLHHRPTHLLFNMIWLFLLGKMIELRYGKWRYLILILVSAAVSNFVQCTVPLAWDGSAPVIAHLPDPILISLLGGFSGVVYALFGFVWTKSVTDPQSRFMLMPSTVAIMLIWLVFCMLPGPQGGSLTEHLFGIRVANWAHFVGLLVGIVFAFLPIWEKRK